MATLAQSAPASSPRLHWLWQFLKQELTPYPGRAGITAHMVIAATLVMLICLTFRIPYGFQGALFALLLSREDIHSTLQSAGTVILFFGLGVCWLLVSMSFVVSMPALHFLWVIGSFFLAFLALGVLTNYGAASAFAIVLAFGVPLWDRHVSAETNVEDTLWLSLSVFVGIAVTVATELAFARLRGGDEITFALVERLETVRNLLLSWAEGRTPAGATRHEILKLESRGTSILRRVLRRSGYLPDYRIRMSGVVALVGRLVDVAATLTQLHFDPTPSDRAQFRDLAAALDTLRTGLLNKRTPGAIQFTARDREPTAVPLLREMQNVAQLIPAAFAASSKINEYLPRSEEITRSKLLVADALANPEHLRFALKGCFAASACYIIYNCVFWPGLSTSVTTCLLTALSTIGSSRQKQILRLVGFFVGGVLLGMGSQIFILPAIDSITAFTLLFIFVTALSAWIMTSSPRLSYLGFQIAFGFYFLNLLEFTKQTSLAVARDRVVGILLGLLMMWLIFDRLWSAPAGREMRKTLISTLRLLAQFSRGPLSDNRREEVKRSFALRDTISASFDKGRALADGVLFEFGPTRQQDLAFRECIRQWQPQLRALFLMRISSTKYRLRLEGFELPDAVLELVREYDDRSAEMLDEMADRIAGTAPPAGRAPADSSELLKRTTAACCGEEAQRFPAQRLQSLCTLLQSIHGLTTSLAKEIGTAS